VEFFDGVLQLQEFSLAHDRVPSRSVMDPTRHLVLQALCGEITPQ
jgi:hypothetical protein